MPGPSRKESVGPDGHRPESGRPGDATPPPRAPAGHSDNFQPDQQVMDMLAGFEEGLADLRRLWDEHRTAETRLKEKEAAVARLEAEHKAQSEVVAAELQAARQQQQELEARQREFQTAQEQARQQLEQTEVAHQARQHELAEVEAAVRGREEQLTAQQRAIDEREAGLRALAERVAEIERDAAATKAAAEHSIATAHEELRSASSDRDVLAKELEKREALGSALQVQIETHRAELEALKTRLAESDTALASADQQSQAVRGEADQAALRLQEQLRAHEIRLTDLTAELEQAQAELVKAREHAAAAPRAGRGAAELTEARRRIADLEAQHHAAASQVEAATTRIAELERQHADHERQRADHERQLAEHGAAAQRMGTLESEEITALRSELDRTKTELSLAVQSCDQAHADLKKAQARASRRAAGSGIPPAFAKDAAAIEQRRLRLARVKGLHREQSNKIRAASDALRKRMEQCEQVLAFRADLSQARHALDQAHRRVQKQRAVGRVAAALMSMSIVIAMLAALSWVIAGQIWPGEFIATARIQAIARGRELLPEEREEWQKYHEELAGDPRFLEKAAENLAKRGIITLAQPGALGEYLRAHLTQLSPGAGNLTFQLHDDGPDRPTRILDTVVTTLASEANAARAKRIDGGTTDINEAATAAAFSIDDTRLQHAGMLWGGSVGLFGVLAIIIWGRLAAAKLKYEGQMHVDHVLEPDRWPAVPGLVPARPTGSPVPNIGSRG